MIKETETETEERDEGGMTYRRLIKYDDSSFIEWKEGGLPTNSKIQVFH